MRLLNTRTLKVEEFPETHLPSYAVVSHTWRDRAQEVSYADLDSLTPANLSTKSGYQKIQGACRLARNDGLGHLWMDTVCIKPNSNVELSEIMNSFSWFERAEKCYVHLQDVVLTDEEETIAEARWFTRCWTLPELIAPSTVEIYDHSWNPLGTRHGLAPTIARKTGIDPIMLRDRPGRTSLRQMLDSFSIAERMSWAADRRTTRPEDVAYSLLGIFHVSFPLLYGEGLFAFTRLQQAILRTSSDQSIIAHSPPQEEVVGYHELEPCRFLAPSPAWFHHRLRSNWSHGGEIGHMRLSDDELTISVLLCPVSEDGIFAKPEEVYIAMLDCVVGNDLLARPALLLQRAPGTSAKFLRLGPTLFEVSPKHPEECRQILRQESGFHNNSCTVKFDPSRARRTKVTLVEPQPVSVMGPVRIPLHVKLEQRDGADERYSIGISWPPLQGGYTRPLEKPRAQGYLTVVNQQHARPFVVMWGLVDSPMLCWCRVLSQHDAARLGCPLEDLVTPGSWEIGGQDDIFAHTDLKKFGFLSRGHSVRLGSLEIEAQIYVVTFLDREALELVVRVGFETSQGSAVRSVASEQGL